MENEGPQGPDIVPVRPPTQHPSSPFMEELDDSGLPSFPGPDLVRPVRGGLSLQGARSRHGGASSAAPPVLHIDMDLEWDEMTMPGEEIMDAEDFVNPQSNIGDKSPGGRW